MGSPKFPFFITFTFIAHVGHMTLNTYLINFGLWKSSKLTMKFSKRFVTKWKRIELEPSGHLINHKPFMKWERVELEPNGHVMDYNRFLEWEKVQLKFGGHLMNHDLFKKWKRVEWNFYLKKLDIKHWKLNRPKVNDPNKQKTYTYIEFL